MIYITGDTHADFSRFLIENFPIQNEMTKDDYVIICGDFGGVWTFEKENIQEKYWLDGEIFDIDNKKFFAFGGARSHDIQDGILNLDQEEKIYEYRKRGAYFRIRDFSWWDLELPTEEEMQNGIKNLEKVNYKVDYIISHCCPTSIQTLLNPSYKKDILTDYLQKISEKCEFKKWYFGHYHDYRQINSQFTLLYENIVPLEFNSIFK